MSDLVGNPEDQFSCIAAHFGPEKETLLEMKLCRVIIEMSRELTM